MTVSLRECKNNKDRSTCPYSFAFIGGNPEFFCNNWQYGQGFKTIVFPCGIIEE